MSRHASIVDLANVAMGFPDPVHDSQGCFREALQALSTPGAVVPSKPALNAPPPLLAPAAAILLTLLDSDCTLWLSASLRQREVFAFFRFHTGCKIVSEIGDAQFALVHDELELPRLACFEWGSDEYPDRSATLIVQVGQLAEQGAWRLTGPGIEHSRSVRAGALPLWFVGDWASVHASFPRGIDMFLCTDAQLMALPRTTQIAIGAESCTSR